MKHCFKVMLDQDGAFSFHPPHDDDFERALSPAQIERLADRAGILDEVSRVARAELDQVRSDFRELQKSLRHQVEQKLRARQKNARRRKEITRLLGVLQRERKAAERVAKQGELDAFLLNEAQKQRDEARGEVDEATLGRLENLAEERDEAVRENEALLDRVAKLVTERNELQHQLEMRCGQRTEIRLMYSEAVEALTRRAECAEYREEFYHGEIKRQLETVRQLCNQLTQVREERDKLRNDSPSAQELEAQRYEAQELLCKVLGQRDVAESESRELRAQLRAAMRCVPTEWEFAYQHTDMTDIGRLGYDTGVTVGALREFRETLDEKFDALLKGSSNNAVGYTPEAAAPLGDQDRGNSLRYEKPDMATREWMRLYRPADWDKVRLAAAMRVVESFRAWTQKPQGDDHQELEDACNALAELDEITERKGSSTPTEVETRPPGNAPTCWRAIATEHDGWTPKGSV